MKKKFILLGIINTAVLIVFVILMLVSDSIKNSITSQQAADKWSGESNTRFAQVSCFMADSSAVSKEKITSTGYSIDDKLKEASIAPYISENSRERIWTYAYSASAPVTLINEKKSVEVNAVAAGGDFFIFHPLEMMSGDCFTPDDLMQDRIVVDEDIAWQLFGSKNIVGMTVQISGKTFLIAGVNKKPEDSLSELTYGKEPRMYMSFDAYSDIFPDDSYVTCFETCLPNPVDDFAKDIVKKAIGLDEKKIKLVENSDRYSVINSAKFIKSFAKRYAVDSEIYYPSWENSARIAEGRVALLLALQIVFLLPPVITVIVLFIAGYIALKKNRRNIFNSIKSKLNKLKKIKKEKRMVPEINESKDVNSDDKKVLLGKN